MTTLEVDLTSEFAALRHGRGLWRPGVHDQVGHAVAEWAGVPPGCTDGEVRRLVDVAIGLIPDADLPADERETVRVAIGLDRRYPATTLTKRIELLASERKQSGRTMRRRVDDAFALLAQVIAKRTDRLDPERGWSVRRLRVLVRLDSERPQVREERTIVATRDNLDRIVARFSVPRTLDGEDVDREVSAEIQHGARIAAGNRQGSNHFRYLLDLPRVLARGDEHTYAIVFKVSDGLPITDHYVFNPLTSCASFEARVRFASSHLPVAVWRTDRTVPRSLPHRGHPDGPMLSLDGAGEVAQTFDDLEQGFSYGICWRYD